jgi:hypothetical protein
VEAIGLEQLDRAIRDPGSLPGRIAVGEPRTDACWAIAAKRLTEERFGLAAR